MVYAELIFIDNFAVDVLLMALTLHISSTRVYLWKLAISGVIGGMYAVAAVCLGGGMIWMPVKLLIGVGMCAVHELKNIRVFAYNCALFFGTAMLTAGAAMLLGKSSGNIIQFSSKALRYVVFGLLAALIIYEIICRNSYPKIDVVYVIRAVFDGKTAELSAKLDTGNCIKDIFGRSVIVADKSALERQLGSLDKFDVEFYVSTAAGKCVLKGRMPDKLQIDYGGRQYLTKAYICVADGLLRGDINAIIGPEMRLFCGGKFNVQ